MKAAIAIAILLAGCSSVPVPSIPPPDDGQFKLGKQVKPPMGCLEGRERGVNC